MNRLIEGLNNAWKNERYNMLMFADDVIILDRSRREVEEKVNVYKVECRMLGLKINSEKSEIMKIGKNKGVEDCITRIRMRDRIKYLEIKVDCRGDMSEFVEEKIKMSKRMVGYMAYVVRGRG